MISVRKNKALSAGVQSLPRWKAYLATPNSQLIPAGGLPSELSISIVSQRQRMSER